jgi:hypothetical protein
MLSVVLLTGPLAFVCAHVEEPVLQKPDGPVIGFAKSPACLCHLLEYRLQACRTGHGPQHAADRALLFAHVLEFTGEVPAVPRDASHSLSLWRSGPFVPSSPESVGHATDSARRGPPTAATAARFGLSWQVAKALRREARGSSWPVIRGVDQVVHDVAHVPGWGGGGPRRSRRGGLLPGSPRRVARSTRADRSCRRRCARNGRGRSCSRGRLASRRRIWTPSRRPNRQRLGAALRSSLRGARFGRLRADSIRCRRLGRRQLVVQCPDRIGEEVLAKRREELDHAFAAALCQYLVRLVVDAEETVDLGRNQWCGRRDGRTSENPISQFRGTRERVRAAAGAADNEEPLEAKFVGNS